jgi:hypothetical protein
MRQRIVLGLLLTLLLTSVWGCGKDKPQINTAPTASKRIPRT